MSRSLWLALSTVLVVGLAACGSSAPPPPSPPPPRLVPEESAPPPEAPPPSTDQQFLDTAAAGGMAEVDLSKLAHAQAASKAVRDFAAGMVKYHTARDNRLLALAQKLNMTAAPAPEQIQGAHDQLAALSGPDFDRQYAFGQVKGHQDMIALYAHEAAAGQSPQLRRFAREELRLLRIDLQRSEELVRHIGGRSPPPPAESGPPPAEPGPSAPSH
jgi:putative membrane protein